jgi:hypothetical protein
MAAGARRTSARRDPLICPTSPSQLRERSAVSPATRPVGGPGTTRPQPSHRPHPRAVRDTRRPPCCHPGSLMELGRVPARPHPRSPALNSVIEGSGILARGWRLRLWAPFFCLSSDFLFLLPFFSLPGELRALTLPGAPLLPLPSGAPLLPRHRGATGGRQFPPSLLGRGMMVPIHHPSRGSSHRTRRGPEALPPLIREATTRRCRAGFRRRLQFLS